jgi:hypothetical protein
MDAVRFGADEGDDREEGEDTADADAGGNAEGVLLERRELRREGVPDEPDSRGVSDSSSSWLPDSTDAWRRLPTLWLP